MHAFVQYGMNRMPARADMVRDVVPALLTDKSSSFAAYAVGPSTGHGHMSICTAVPWKCQSLGLVHCSGPTQGQICTSNPAGLG